MKDQTFLENGNKIRIFDDNGDGQAGYRIYVVSTHQEEQVFVGILLQTKITCLLYPDVNKA